MTEERYKEINEKIQSLIYDFRYVWCESHACSCMGCVNMLNFDSSLLLKEEEHNEWIERNPYVDPRAKIKRENEELKLFFESLPKEKILAVKKIIEILKIDIVEALKLYNTLFKKFNKEF